MIPKAVLAAAIAIGVLNPPAIHAQSAQPRPSFEVASVKPIDRATMSRDHEGKQLDAERFLDRTDLLQYIVRAYIDVAGVGCIMKAGLGEDCPFITGNLPPWIKTDRWEILAKLPPNSVPAYTAWQLHVLDTPQLNQMLQVLLEDRFHLKVHREMRELPVYALTVGKNGPKLEPTPPGGELMKAADGSSLEVHGMRGTERVPTQDGSVRQRLNFQSSSMQEAADSLSWYFERPVLDQTALKGRYDFALEYEVDPDEHGPATAGNTSGDGGGFVQLFSGLSGSALSVALQEVGLKLESTKAPVHVLVVDHVEKPSGN